ncbi:MAG: aminotransferase class I/II-fold pyridoxal phosphate-dependent enzyme, partial [Betaproteobacteria bacterium]|nr:aminotransferase class I/II-fold pyridoxal phosphate-dependent enzyme [Betaproteobacteria bacterium]
KLWSLCEHDIYKKKYSGLYCVGCEAFYDKEELDGGKCPDHRVELELIEEENYFFALSKYQTQIEEIFKKDLIKIYPESRKNEMLGFVQRAGVAAMQRAADIVPTVVLQMQACRDRLFAELESIPGLDLALPDGGMYAFFSIPGLADDVQTAKRLVAEAGLGLAPGSAFAPEAQGWLRWCFASQDPDRLGEGARRLKGWLSKL